MLPAVVVVVCVRGGVRVELREKGVEEEARSLWRMVLRLGR